MRTLSDKIIQEQALRHHKSEQDREQIKATTLSYPDMTIDDAYAIQKAWMDIKLSEGQKTVGYKIGLTSKVMQRAMCIDEPDFGMLLENMVFDNGDSIDTSLLLDPRIEVELAFVLKKNISGHNVTLDQILDATDYISPAVELIAARSHRIDPDTGYKRTVKDTISDNAANAGIILGNAKINPKTTDLRWISALLIKNDVIEESGVAAAVLGHPALGIVWLAQKYADHNVPLLAGQIILAGSFTSAIKVQNGDNIMVDFNQFGQINCSFT